MRQGKFDLVAGEISSLQREADRALDLRVEGGHANPRRAKIIATIGPSSNTKAALRDLLRLGMDVARLNFSHGSHEEHARNIERIRRAARREGRTVCILQDLQGPKIRTGRLKGHDPVLLESGSRVTITPRDVLGTPRVIATTFAGLAREVGPGARVLLSDGLIELRVRGRRGQDLECDVVNGGLLAEHQGINLPGAALTIPALTDKDRKDLEFGLKHAVDLVAISFVRSASDVREVKQLILDHGGNVPVIAKLEKPQALEQLEEIFEAADGVMVARGDLGVEMLPEQVPVIQKHVIRRAAEWRKPVIIATQMLESMIENPRPTRAEASDVANAVFDGTDAVMLSGGDCEREISARSGCDDEPDCHRGRAQHGGVQRASPPADPSPAFRGRSDLRIDRACGGRSAHGRDRDFHGEWKHRPHDFEVPAAREHLRFQPYRPGVQPAEFVLGRAPRAAP